jgi:simple sugar transport system ATP-binding protein
MNRSAMDQQASGLIDRFGILCTGPRAPMWSLSGGNQQRVVLARELSHDPVVLVAAQPTRGLDVGAIEYMSSQLRAVASAGVAVLLISTELEEILDLADRIVVISNGRIVGQMQRWRHRPGRARSDDERCQWLTSANGRPSTPNSPTQHRPRSSRGSEPPPR